MKHFFRIAGFLILSSFVSCKEDEVMVADVTVRVNILMDGAPLVLNDETYSNLGNDFIVEKFMVYLSQFELINDMGAIQREKDSYHLVKAENGVAPEFIIPDIPIGTYTTVKFGLGVDEPANLSIDQTGDLDPTNQMAWNWNIGYKYVLFEGRHTDSVGNDVGLIYHIGFTENYYVHHYPIPQFLQVGTNGGSLDINMEVSELFKNPNTIDMVKMNNVQFDKSEVSVIVENYKNGFIEVD